MFTPGLVSVTYRPLTPDEIISAAVRSGLSAIEWGGDVHVPHGDLAAAETVGRKTREAGLSVISYGTYYKAGAYGDAFRPVFSSMLDTAEALGAPSLRLWAGTKGTKDTDAAGRARLVDELRVCASMAAERGLRIAFEYHGGTLTDNAVSARRLIEEIGADSARLYWQPNQHVSHEENIQNLKTVLPCVTNVHVFAWEGGSRFPLADHESRWRDYLSLLNDGKDHGLLLEFVPDNDPAILPREARTLLSWLRR